MKLKQILTEWVIPKGFQSLFFECKEYLKGKKIRYERIKRQKEHNLLLKKNLQFKDIHKGKRCFIIGNGPSIKKQDLTVLKNEFTFVANYFYLHKDYEKIHPNFYCIIDPHLFTNSEICQDFFTALSKKLHGDTLLFLSILGRHLDKSVYLRNTTKHFLYMEEAALHEGERPNLEIDKPIPGLENVVQACLLIAGYMGFSQVYLLGCDHDWLKLKGSTMTKHFYKKSPKLPFFHEMSYEWKINYTFRLFKGYRYLKEKFSNTKIYNCTPGSYLDIFEYKKFEDIISSKK